jgi:HK97 gp10 family phage protein
MGSNPSVRKFRTDMTELVNRAKQNFHETLLKQADELAGNIKDAAPKLTGALASSVRTKDVSTKDGTKLSVLVIAGGPKTTKRTASGQAYDYALATEFGTQNEVAEPFFYNSARLYSKNGIEQYKETLAETIEENNRIRATRSNNYSNPSRSSISVGHRGAVVIQKGSR